MKKFFTFLGLTNNNTPKRGLRKQPSLQYGLNRDLADSSDESESSSHRENESDTQKISCNQRFSYADASSIADAQERKYSEFLDHELIRELMSARHHNSTITHLINIILERKIFTTLVNNYYLLSKNPHTIQFQILQHNIQSGAAREIWLKILENDPRPQLHDPFFILGGKLISEKLLKLNIIFLISLGNAIYQIFYRNYDPCIKLINEFKEKNDATDIIYNFIKTKNDSLDISEDDIKKGQSQLLQYYRNQVLSLSEDLMCGNFYGDFQCIEFSALLGVQRINIARKENTILEDEFILNIIHLTDNAIDDYWTPGYVLAALIYEKLGKYYHDRGSHIRNKRNSNVHELYSSDKCNVHRDEMLFLRNHYLITAYTYYLTGLKLEQHCPNLITYASYIKEPNIGVTRCMQYKNFKNLQEGKDYYFKMLKNTFNLNTKSITEASTKADMEIKNLIEHNNYSYSNSRK